MLYNGPGPNPGGEYNFMSDDLHRLLRFIVERPLLRSEQLDAERNATAVQDVEQEMGGIAEDSRNHGERLAPAFAQGLRAAAQAGGPLVVDDTDRTGNDIADAFARFLVTTNLASSQSTDLGDEHYRYSFEVNWPRLRDVATSAGIDLDAALRPAS